MSLNNEIKTVFTSKHAKDNFAKMDAVFLSEFYGFLKKLGVVELELNSTFRPNEKINGSHAWGRALDINRMKYSSGKSIYFNFKFGNLQNEKDDENFYKEVLKHFGDKLYNYYSPALVRHATSKIAVNNTFRYSKTKIADVTKAESIPASKRGWNESHLNHLHIAIDMDGKMKEKKLFALGIKKNWKSLIPTQLAGDCDLCDSLNCNCK